MQVSVLIITKNQKVYLQKSLPILLGQNFKCGHEIIVVDSGSTDGAMEYIEKLPVKLVKIQPGTFNFAKAFNEGAQAAEGECLVRLSGDAIPIGEKFLTEMVKPFKDLKVGGTYGRYTISGRAGYGYPDYWPQERFPEKLTRYSVEPSPLNGISVFGIEFGDHKKSEMVFNFAGACCAIRRDIWQRRPFNENLIAAEDAEYSWFLHLVGYDIVCNPKAEVLHEHKIGGKPVLGRWKPSKWQLVFTWQITKYWLLKCFLIDPFEKFRV